MEDVIGEGGEILTHENGDPFKKIVVPLLIPLENGKEAMVFIEQLLAPRTNISADGSTVYRYHAWWVPFHMQEGTGDEVIKVATFTPTNQDTSIILIDDYLERINKAVGRQLLLYYKIDSDGGTEQVVNVLQTMLNDALAKGFDDQALIKRMEMEIAWIEEGGDLFHELTARNWSAVDGRHIHLSISEWLVPDIQG